MFYRFATHCIGFPFIHIVYFCFSAVTQSVGIWISSEMSESERDRENQNGVGEKKFKLDKCKTTILMRMKIMNAN